VIPCAFSRNPVAKNPTSGGSPTNLANTPKRKRQRNPGDVAKDNCDPLKIHWFAP
jgi:hypothetical protein